MEVYVVSFNNWMDHEYDYTMVEKVFTSKKSADNYIESQSHRVTKKVYEGSDFETAVLELEE